MDDLTQLAMDVAAIKETTKNTHEYQLKQDKHIEKFFSIVEGEDGVVTRMVLNTRNIEDNADDIKETRSTVTRLQGYLFTLLLAIIALVAGMPHE